MSVYHTPLCRITWTAVVPSNVVRSQDFFSVQFGVSYDAAIWSTFGTFQIDWGIFADDGRNVGVPYWRGWTPTDIPHNANIWLGNFWPQAQRATGGRLGVFLFRPYIQFRLWGPGGTPITGEFAVAEEDHYFSIDF